MKSTKIINTETKTKAIRSFILSGAMSIVFLAACTKDNSVAEKSLDQQKIEFQSRQLEIEKQKLAIEKEKMDYETQKKKTVLRRFLRKKKDQELLQDLRLSEKQRRFM